MKKFISMLLAACLMLSMAACGQSEGNNTETTLEQASSDSDTTTDGRTGEKIKLGVIIWGSSDALARNATKMVQRMVELSGGEVVVDTNYTSPETQIQAAENLIAGGCNSIIIVNTSDTMLPKLGELCEENEVYWGLMWRRMVSDDVKEQMKNYKYYIGNTSEDEIEIASRLTNELADSGVKELAVVSAEVGDTTHDNRNEGIRQACEERGVERVSEFRDSNLNAAKVMEAVEKFITGYPNLDAIFLTGGTNSQLEGALAALDKHGKRSKIKLAVVDFIDADLMEEYLKDGTLFAIAGGHYVDPMFTTSMLINAVEGNRLSDTAEEIEVKFVDFRSFEDAKNYYTYVENDADDVYAYNDEEMKNMIKSYNESFTIDDLKQIASDYSVEDVMTRHGDK